MTFLDKIEPLLLILAVGAGLLLGLNPFLREMSKAFVSPFLTCMLLGLFWEVPLKDISKSFHNVKFTSTSLIINFIWTPAFAWTLSRLFMDNQPMLALGFVLLMVTPCTDWYLVFTGMSKGNVPLSVALLPLNLICQVLLLPVYILILGGDVGWTDPGLLLKSAVLALVVPFCLAKALKWLLEGKAGPTRLMETLFAKRQFVWLWLAICMMFASERIIGEGYLPVFLSILFPVLIFFLANFWVSRTTGRLMGFDRPDTVSLIFTTLARNSPLALAFAQRAFPGERQVLLPLIIGPLVELPILALIAQLIVTCWKGKENGEPAEKGA
ncbi:MAG: bile acid:sodium symporter [Deltaproteobacteria bacterium]|jgi:ACR3 family arsenite efflux pump ArsB|nr:bile acid:sodium symporter [Deltaproteobacteria bacterium]